MGAASQYTNPRVAIMRSPRQAFIFALSYFLGVVSTPRQSAAGAGLQRGALFAIYGTQSDDIALGVPVLGWLFPQHVCPLYVLSAMQVGLPFHRSTNTPQRPPDESQ